MFPLKYTDKQVSISKDLPVATILAKRVWDNSLSLIFSVW